MDGAHGKMLGRALVLAILHGKHPRFLFVPEHEASEVTDQVRAMHWQLYRVMAEAAVLVLLRRMLRDRAVRSQATSQ